MKIAVVTGERQIREIVLAQMLFRDDVLHVKGRESPLLGKEAVLAGTSRALANKRRGSPCPSRFPLAVQQTFRPGLEERDERDGSDVRFVFFPFILRETPMIGEVGELVDSSLDIGLGPQSDEPLGDLGREAVAYRGEQPLDTPRRHPIDNVAHDLVPIV